jgi:hypothetical protein
MISSQAQLSLFRKSFGPAIDQFPGGGALGVTLRLVPLLLLITVPWTVAHFSGRVFSVQALGLAMIDILAGWLVVALVEVAAAAALLRWLSARNAPSSH